MSNFIEREASEITPIKMESIPHEKISESNKVKWKSISREYGCIYEETKTFSKYSNLLNNDSYNLLKCIIELYFNSKKLDPKTIEIKRAIFQLFKIIEMSTDSTETNELLCKIEALTDFINENRT